MAVRYVGVTSQHWNTCGLWYLQQAAQLGVQLLAQDLKCVVAAAVAWDGVMLRPVATRKLIEVLAGVCGLVTIT